MDIREQFTKFSPVTLAAKSNLKKLRLRYGHSMNTGARLLGISRKQLEDLETDRNYGSHIDLEILARAARLFHTTATNIIGLCPDSDAFFERPRKQGPKT